MPTLIYTRDSPPATFVLENADAVNTELERARERGDETISLTGEGGKTVPIQINAVTRVSPQ
jgi:hypothetical protein